MRNAILVAATVALAACLQLEPADPMAEAAASSAPVSAGTGDGNGSAANPPVVTAGLTGENPTRNETLRFEIETTGPVVATLRLNGTEVFAGEVSDRGAWDLPLPYGRTPFEYAITGPGVSLGETLELVRLGGTVLRIDYGVFHPGSQGAPRTESHEIWIDVDARPSEAQYVANGTTHIDGFTAHDQLVVFENLTGKKVEYEYFASFQGFAVNRIDGAGSPITSDTPPWWCYDVNGASADGISIQRIEPGDEVDWNLGGCT